MFKYVVDRFLKSVKNLSKIVFYTLTGALLYYFKGENVSSPALLDLSPMMQKVVFGISLPVIFISGSINTQTAAKYLYDLIFPRTSSHHLINTKKGIIVWISLGAFITIIGVFHHILSEQTNTHKNHKLFFPPSLYRSFQLFSVS